MSGLYFSPFLHIAHIVDRISLAIVNTARCGAIPFISVISKYARRNGLSFAWIAAWATCLAVYFKRRLYSLVNFSPDDLLTIPSPAYIQTFLLSAKRWGVSRMADIVAALVNYPQ